MTKVYIASHSRELAEEHARRLLSEVVSRWHDKEFLPTDQHTEGECFQIAIEDLNDIRECDELHLLAGDEKYSGGKFVEAGIAYGLGKVVRVYGRRENMLTYLFEKYTE